MKKILLTLMALFMASAAMAESYFYLEGMSLAPGEQVTVPVRASFDGRVCGFLVDVACPDGLALVSYENGPDLTIPYFDKNGVQRNEEASLYPNEALTRFVGVTMTFGYWDPDGSGVYERYGMIKWEAGEYDDMFYLTFEASEGFQGGTIIIETQVSGGEDTRGGTVDELGETHQTFVRECTVNAELPEPEVTPSPTITYFMDEYNYTVYAEGEGDVRLYCNGEEVSNPFEVARPYEYGTELQFMATAQIPGMLISDPVEMAIYIEPIIMMIDVAAPVISSNVDDDYVTINVAWPESPGEHVLLVNGVIVENPDAPYVIARGDYDLTFIVEAFVQAADMYMESEHVVMSVNIPAKDVEPDPDPVTGTFFTMTGGEILHGNTIVIPVSLTNGDAVTAFQTDLYMPEGFELIDAELTDRAVNHTLLTNYRADGSIRILCYSATLSDFEGYDGVLFNLTVRVPEEAGEYTLMLKKNIVTTTNLEEVRCEDASCTVNVLPFIMGDANGSGSVTIADASVTANYVLELNPDPFIFGAADMNGDGEITVTDVVLIASIVLDPTGNTIFHAPARGSYNNDLMSGEGCNMAIGETRTVTIALDNAMSYTAFQLDVQLPDGLTASNFRLTDRAGSHALTTNTTADGKQRLLCYSPTLSAINGNEGALLTFDVTATGDIYGDIMVDGIEMVTAACQTVYLNSFAIQMNSTATSVKELAGDLRIYTDGENIIVDSPVAQRMIISDVAGHSYSVEVNAGHNVIPARTSGVVVVSNGEKTSKLMLK